ncbi:MAG: hypothetical protein IPP73_14460 [Chitinophagaceae bacterium]|nr:hypothetical protein [Chitinophagaceae bacterium]
MKKMIMTLAMAISSIVALANTEKVNPEVLKSFSTEFNSASEVKWTVAENYFQAEFTYNDQHLFAFYNTTGELTALTRYLGLTEISLSLQNQLKKNYKGYWISDLFEVAKNGDTSYYITLENADSRLVLRSGGQDWETFQKVKKS